MGDIRHTVKCHNKIFRCHKFSFSDFHKQMNQLVLYHIIHVIFMGFILVDTVVLFWMIQLSYNDGSLFAENSNNPRNFCCWTLKNDVSFQKNITTSSSHSKTFLQNCLFFRKKCISFLSMVDSLRIPFLKLHLVVKALLMKSTKFAIFQDFLRSSLPFLVPLWTRLSFFKKVYNKSKIPNWIPQNTQAITE